MAGRNAAIALYSLNPALPGPLPNLTVLSANIPCRAGGVGRQEPQLGEAKPLSGRA